MKPRYRLPKVVATSIPSLQGLYIYLSSYCNLSCLHCWIEPKYLKQERAPDEATLSIFKAAIDQALPLGLKFIKISGGEPFLSGHLFELIAYACIMQLRIIIETNGTLLDSQKAKLLKEFRVALVSVSLDGPNQKIHGYLRNAEACFDKTIQGIRHLKQHNLNVQCIVSVWRHNIGYLAETIRLAEYLGVDSVKINYVMHIARGDQMHKSGLALSISDYLELNRTVNETIQPQRKVKIIVDIPPAFKGINQLISQSSRCKIKNILGILADGRLSLCGIGNVLPELILGNLNNDSLVDVWKNNTILLSLRNELPHKLQGICSRCILKAMCLGKCRAEVYYKEQALLKPYSFCQRAYELGLFPESRLATEREVINEVCVPKE